ncbi:hypothetical protein M408DRAFT_219910 [Serendipita vermifera MAFF 305830]|uniref:Uncharacterized protein n=1 Tax=Serendipita vermifera MAFF 305830 TaxID=933852 RepID=A0A0C2X2K4_SERVB|nr:hypothetical protein M408DRAFT_219910 [Serendipita vermifera MAFF 305830]
MRSHLFSLAVLPLVSQVVTAAACRPLASDTYTVLSTTCIYACNPTPTPTVTYTALSTITIAQSLPCPEITTEPGPGKVKRVGTAVSFCPPTTVTSVSTVVCTSCPGTTTAKATTQTSVTTVTKYKSCP